MDPGNYSIIITGLWLQPPGPWWSCWGSVPRAQPLHRASVLPKEAHTPGVAAVACTLSSTLGVDGTVIVTAVGEVANSVSVINVNNNNNADHQSNVQE
jgi:hypothetical protein